MRNQWLSICLGITTILCIGAPGIARAEEEKGDAWKFIDGANRELARNLENGNAAAIANGYTVDARLLPPNADLLTGRQAVEAFWQGAVDAKMTLTLVAKKVQEAGDYAIETGEFNSAVPGPGGEPIRDSGKYVVVWRRTGETWKMDIDIWNSNSPAQ